MPGIDNVSDDIVATGTVQDDGAAIASDGILTGVDLVPAAGKATIIVRSESATGEVLMVASVGANGSSVHPRCFAQFKANLHFTVTGTAPTSCILRGHWS